MRLVDATKLSDAFDEEGADIYADFGEESKWGFSYSLVYDLIARAPEIDAVPVVRCKDCKYAETEKMYANLLFCVNGNLCDGKPLTMRPNDFCSYGKRKE